MDTSSLLRADDIALSLAGRSSTISFKDLRSASRARQRDIAHRRRYNLKHHHHSKTLPRHPLDLVNKPARFTPPAPKEYPYWYTVPADLPDSPVKPLKKREIFNEAQRWPAPVLHRKGHKHRSCSPANAAVRRWGRQKDVWANAKFYDPGSEAGRYEDWLVDEDVSCAWSREEDELCWGPDTWEQELLERGYDAWDDAFGGNRDIPTTKSLGVLSGLGPDGCVFFGEEEAMSPSKAEWDEIEADGWNVVSEEGQSEPELVEADDGTESSDWESDFELV